jgi:CRP-like cAMP-binding protein
MYGDMIRKCTLFSGLNEPDLQYALHFFESSRGFYSKGDTMNRVGDPLPSFGLLLAGSAQVNMDDMDGGHMIMATVAPGDTFGESLNFLGMDAPVYITAMTDVAVLWMKTTRMKDGSAPKDSRDIQLSNRFTAMLAERTLAMNNRIQILSKITLRAKLVTLFSQCMQQTNNEYLSLPFDRHNMAVYLGADRSALSRELSKMRQEGIIDFHKNQVHIKKHVF